MVSRASLYSFAVMLGACLPSMTMEVTVQRSAEPSRTSRKIIEVPTEFTSAEEMIKYGRRMFQAVGDKDFELAFELASYNPPISFDNPVDSDTEAYLYYRTVASVAAFKAKSEGSQLYPKKALVFNISGIKVINEYLKQFGSITSEIQSFNDLMLLHRQKIYDLAGQCYLNVAILKQNTDYPKDQRIAALRNAMNAYESSVGFCNTFVKLINEDKSEALTDLQDQSRTVILPDIQLNLLIVYCNLAQLCSLDEASALMQKARVIYKTGTQKKWNKMRLETALGIIKATEDRLSSNRQPRITPTSKKVETIRSQNNMKAALERHENIKNIQGKANNKELLVKAINDKYTSLQLLMCSEVEAYSRIATELMEGLKDIEKTIGQHLNIDFSSELPMNYLESIYEHLPRLLTVDGMRYFAFDFIPAFIINGDIEGAIQRANLIKQLEIKYKGEASLLTRFMAAFAKNLIGDHEEWLSLEAEEGENIAEKKSKKKAQKERSEQNMVEAMKLSLSSQQQKKVNLTPSIKPTLNTKKVLESSLNQEGIVPFAEVIVNDKQRKADKQKRHEQAEAKRQQNIETPKASQKDRIFSQTENKGDKDSKDDVLEQILLSSDRTLRDLYTLSALPLIVDVEIESGTWRFTRDEFQLYLKGLECVCKPGKGIHIKGSLPKATHVMQGENVITILNDFGGALTLPLWDKNNVPNYLKTQILEARNKLRALKLKALQIEHG